MKQILKDRSFQLSIILTFIFFGTGITFLFLGLADYSAVLFILLPIVLGVAIGAGQIKNTLWLGQLLQQFSFYLVYIYLASQVCFVS